MMALALATELLELELLELLELLLLLRLLPPDPLMHLGFIVFWWATLPWSWCSLRQLCSAAAMIHEHSS